MLVACAQMRSTTDVHANLDQVVQQVRRASSLGVTLVATPENTTFLGPASQKLRIAEPLDGPTHRALAVLAREERIWLLVGSVAELYTAPDGGPSPGLGARDRCYNTSLLFDPDGVLRASYRKIHLFDVDIPGGPMFRESAFVVPGADLVTAETPLGTLGLSICFDVRFPQLYAGLVKRGATVLSVPSAFTVPTGKDHWHLLLRARAVESQAYVLAPAQDGRHDNAGPGGQALRQSYGHSLIVDPWGCVLADAGEGNPEGLALAEIDPALVRRVRDGMPLHSPLGSP